MFGYVNINKNLEDGQRGLWQAFMCGLCFSTKKLFGNTPRMFITNDINFLNVLFHSVENIDVELEQKRCFSHPVKKRSMVKIDDLSDKISVANVILNYLKLYDDVVDDGGAKKKAALKMYKKPYRKAQKLWGGLDKTVCQGYEQLRSLEKENCKVLDVVAHSFATLSQNLCREVLSQPSEHAETLCYNVGKWIYLIDALDDLEKDLQKGSYNPFVACYDLQKAEDIVAHKEEISFLMFAVLNRIAQSFNDLNLIKYTCVLKNIVYYSLREQTGQVMQKLKLSEKK